MFSRLDQKMSNKVINSLANMTRLKYRRVLFFIIILFIVFDGIRSNIIYNQYFSPLKEFCILLLFFEARSIRNDKKRKLPITLIILTSYIVLMMFVSLMDISYVPKTQIVLVGYKFTQIALLTYSFYYFEELTNYTYKKAFRLLIACCCIYTIINILSLLINIPIWKDNDMWFGRLSRGYPTTDTAVLIFALASLLFLKLGYNVKQTFVIALLLIISILMQNTGSGLILLPITLGIYVGKNIFKSRIFFSLKTYIVIALMIILGVFVINKFKERNPLLFENMSLVLQSKIDNFIYGRESTSDFKENSIDARQNQYNNAKSYMYSDLDKIIGLGTSRYTLDLNILQQNKGTFTIENMFFTIIICYGIFGFTLYVLMFLESIIMIFRIKESLDNKIFYFVGIVIFAVSSNALTSLYFVQTFGIMSITLALVYKRSNYEHRALF